MLGSSKYTEILICWFLFTQTITASQSLFNISALSGSDVTSQLTSNAYTLMEQPITRLQNLIRGSILPTHWCGIRNSAPFPEAISAVYPHLDSCCREHDTCPVHIKRGKCSKGICNKSFLAPILSCDCEFAFRKCLQSLPSPKSFARFALSGNERLTSDIVGTIYFVLLPKALHGTKAEMKCIKKIKVPTFYQTLDGNEKRSFYTEQWKAYSLKDLKSLRVGWFKSSQYFKDIAEYSGINNFIKVVSSQLLETN